MKRVLGIVLAALWVSAAAFAHDFWIEPSTFRPAVGSRLAAALRVGQDFRGDPVPRNSRLISRFSLVTSSGEKPVEGFEGVEPAGLVTVDRAGLNWIAYRSGRTSIVLEPDKFEKYLSEEGLEKISALRLQRGERDQPGREVFSRSVKSLVIAGAVSAADPKGFDRVLGLTLEIVLRKDPRALRAGQKLPVTLLYEGKPLEGALVTSMDRENGERKIRARTDRRGQANLAIGRQGVWLVKAVQMVPAPPDAQADWESIWTSLTFEIP